MSAGRSLQSHLEGGCWQADPKSDRRHRTELWPHLWQGRAWERRARRRGLAVRGRAPSPVPRSVSSQHGAWAAQLLCGMQDVHGRAPCPERWCPAPRSIGVCMQYLYLCLGITLTECDDDIRAPVHDVHNTTASSFREPGQHHRKHQTNPVRRP